MASKSVGQIAGTVIGAAVGFFAGGNVALGASIGGMIGGMIDPPKGPTVVGPRLDDLSFQTSTLGAPLGRAYGTVPILGNVVWLEGDKYLEVITSEEQGGKGGPTATTETAHYYATFAVSLLRVTDATKTIALRRLWIGSNLVYDAGSDNLESIIASNSQSALFTFYSGSDDQQPNTRWQADKGANAVSGFPGRCYIVIYDLDLEPYSRSLAMAQVKVELSSGEPVYQTETITAIQTFNPNGWTPIAHRLRGIVYDNGKLTTCFCQDNDWDGYVHGVTFGEIEFGISQNLLASEASPLAGVGYLHHAPRQITLTQTDSSAIIMLEDMGNYSEYLRLRIHGAGGESIGEIFQSYEVGDQTLGVFYGGYVYIFGTSPSSTAIEVQNISIDGNVLTSAGTYATASGGASENFIFLTAYTGGDTGTQTIFKLSRVDLSLVATYTGSAHSYNTVISVESDSVFYTLSKNYDVVYKWINGVIVDSKSAVVPTGNIFSFKVYSFDPPYIVTCSWNGAGNVYLGHGVVPAEAAKLRDIVTSECGLASVSPADIDLTALTDSDVRGFRISNLGSIRSSLEMLQAAYPFDVAPSGYKLRFVSRGGASLATIPEPDLGATDSASSLPVLLPSAREMDTQIPYKVSVRYLDPAREYDIGEQYAARPDTASVSERTVELSLVLTGDEAAQAADILNQKDWLERVSFGPFSLPPTWRALEPPDVVIVEHRGQAHQIRLSRAEFLPDGRIECAGVYSNAQSYTSSATAQESLTVGQSLVPLKGSTQGYLLDIPRIRSEQDVPGMSYAMTGLASGWPGGVLLRSDDSGNTYQSVGSSNVRSKVFTAGAALAAHHGYSIDHGSVLTVTPSYSGHTLSSVTEDQLYGHANLAAYGADGRWEIVAFRTVTDNTGSYTLKDFLRGLYGTEQYTGTHAVGDYLIMLDTDAVSFFGLPTTAIGSQRLYRAVTQGYAIESAVNIVDTYGAVNLKPLAPVDFKADRGQSSLDFMLSGSRRSRMPVELFSGFGVPVGESAEAYEIEIYDSGFNSLKRTISGLTTLEATYESGDQVTDFGSEIETVYGRSYQISSVIGRGFVSQFQIYRPLEFDPFAASVVLGLHFNGTNGGTSFNEVTGKTMSVAGVTTSTLHSVFGGASAYFSGSSSLGVAGGTDLVIGTSDVSIDFWFKRTIDMGSNTFRIINNWDGTGYMVIVTNNKLRAYINNGTVFDLTGTTTIANDTWYYGEFVRSGANLYLFLNGSLEASSTTFSGSITAPQTDTLIGKATDGNFQYWEGYIDDLRVTKEARHTSGYAVPSQQFIDP